MTTETASVLACGTAVGPLLEQAVDHPGVRTEHQQGCVHCQAALAEFETLWLPVRESAASTPVPPPDLVTRVIHRIRSAVTSPGWALIHQTGGVTRVAVELVLRVIRDAAQSVDGVRSSLATVAEGPGTTVRPVGADGPAVAGPAIRADPADPADLPDLAGPQVGVELGVSGSTVAVVVTVAVEYGPDLWKLGTRIRRQVERQVTATVGISVASVSVRIDDVFPAG